MAHQADKTTEVPLLQSSSSSGTASSYQTLGNIIVSIVGTGVLGLPFAFKVAGWAAGALGVIIVGLSTYYCMLLLSQPPCVTSPDVDLGRTAATCGLTGLLTLELPPHCRTQRKLLKKLAQIQCRDNLASEEESTEAKTYGDLGFKCMGTTGRYLTEFLIFISQCGGSVAYLVFIGQNLSSIFKSHNFTSSSFIFLVIPLQIVLSWINSLSSLSPFSIFANICNVLAMALVVKQDMQMIAGEDFSFGDREAITSHIGGLPFAGGMAVFCFEGFGMTLALESSMKERGRFSKLLAQAFTGVTLVYVLFGFFGYMAYGDQTMDIVTLNLPHNWSSIVVQDKILSSLICRDGVVLGANIYLPNYGTSSSRDSGTEVEEKHMVSEAAQKGF
ncbi:hypothetical protein Patl1_32821 [Pistacia atlantica]|uniref:Uncharacterized protein n=1 Tax=Pistacia atlantica TaxID=434234 RepID=A0ACC1APP8_9ROSI|nr:hypothetical protein Patl1_32821 [Pistacia atlantica]